MPIGPAVTPNAPPRKTTPGEAPRKPGRPSASTVQEVKRATYQGTLLGLAQAGGMLCVAFGNHADAAAIGDHGETAAAGLAQAALEDEKFGNLLELLSKSTGGWMTAAFAVLPLTMQILANHKVIRPAPQMGILPRELMEMRGQQQAQQLAQQAEEQMRQMRTAAEENAA